MKKKAIIHKPVYKDPTKVSYAESSDSDDRQEEFVSRKKRKISDGSGSGSETASTTHLPSMDGDVSYDDAVGSKRKRPEPRQVRPPAQAQHYRSICYQDEA